MINWARGHIQRIEKNEGYERAYEWMKKMQKEGKLTQEEIIHRANKGKL